MIERDRRLFERGEFTGEAGDFRGVVPRGPAEAKARARRAAPAGAGHGLRLEGGEALAPQRLLSASSSVPASMSPSRRSPPAVKARYWNVVMSYPFAGTAVPAPSHKLGGAFALTNLHGVHPLKVGVNPSG